MPHTDDALREDVLARHFGPLDQAAPGFVAIASSFDNIRTACTVSIANVAGSRKGAAPRSVPQSRDADDRESAVPAMRVVVVEDDAVIGTLLAEMLAGMGYDVCAIEATESDAVIAAARCKPDLMIVDVGLGEGSGIAAIDTIHRIRPVPHVFVSADTSKARALRPNSIFIQKPYRESDLARVIRQALDAVPLN